MKQSGIELDSQSEILFNVKQCEELFQKDKSEKLKLDIEIFKQNIKEAKEEELNFYKSLRLAKEEKHRIFNVDGEKFEKYEKVIVWDPLQGNLIMTQREYEDRYVRKEQYIPD